MNPTSARRQAGAMRWWTPLLFLLGGTAAVIFAAALGGVDMSAAGQRLTDRLANTFHSSSTEWNDERGTLRLEFDHKDNLTSATFNGEELPREVVQLEDGYLTVTSLTYDDGELKYWRIPMTREGELLEEVRNLRWWRTLMRVHPQPPELGPGLRVARVGEGSASERAGFQVGDVIVAVEGREFPDSSELERAVQLGLAERAPGGPLTLTVERGAERLDLVLQLEPLVSRAEWDSVDVEDPVRRYMILRHGGHRREFEREASVHEDPDPEATEGLEPGAPEPPPLPPAPDGP